MIKQKVLFLCTGNSSRTQMAEGILRKMAGDQFEVVSAGGSPEELNPAAIETMREIGIDISHYRTKDVAEYLGERFTFLIQLCDRRKEPHCPIFPGAIYRLHWDLEDPEQSDLGVYAATRRSRDQICRHIEDFIRKHA
ncbi:MAG: arsenate reductase ArsC [Bryobacteraceae bacterium]